MPIWRYGGKIGHLIQKFLRHGWKRRGALRLGSRNLPEYSIALLSQASSLVVDVETDWRIALIGGEPLDESCCRLGFRLKLEGTRRASESRLARGTLPPGAG